MSLNTDEGGAPGPQPPPEVPARKVGIHPLVPFLVAGWLLGPAQAVAARGGSRFLTLIFSAALGALFAAPIGLAAWLGTAAVRRVRKRRPAKGGVESVAAPGGAESGAATSAGGAESVKAAGTGETQPNGIDRAAALQRLALAVSALFAGALAVVAARFVLPVLFELQEQDLAKRLATVAVALLLIGALAGAALGAKIVNALFRVIDRRVRVPVPAPRWAVCLLFVTLPLFLGYYPFLRENGAMLGPARDVSMALLVAAAGAQIWLLFNLLPRRARKVVSIVVGTLTVLGVLAAGVIGGRKKVSLAGAEKSPPARLGGTMARALTDVDRDGVSSLFGGEDCAPFDPKRSPSKAETPGNGIDEDCDGQDSVSAADARRLALFSDALGKDQIRKYNVVWVILETVRADHVSALSYDRPTTPYLARLAKESLLFTRAYSQSSATVFSIPSMLSGVEPGAAVWVKEKGHPQLATSVPLLAERLQKKGYRTGFVIDTYIQNSFPAVQRGFDDLLLAEPDGERVNNRPRRNLFSTAKAAEFLAKVDPAKRFFLTVYYPDQHSPYSRQPEVDASAFEQGEIGSYDSELAFADQQIRALVEVLKARPSVWDDTILVINADHGEEFGEHGGSRHAQTCHEESVHVPLLVRIPGIAPQRVDARVGLVDVVPTLLEAMGDREKVEHLNGQSLFVPALRPEKLDPARPLTCDIASVTNKFGTFHRRAVRTGKYALFQDVTEGRFELYDSESDLFEHADLSGQGEQGARMALLRQLLEASLTGNLTDHTKLGLGRTEQAAPPR